MDDFELQTKSLSEQVYEYLTNQIIDGAFDYGRTLNIKEIAAGLRTSTMPVREAIKRLENEGVVAVHPRSHCVLRMPTKDSILSASDMRKVIESYCVGRILADHSADTGRLRNLLDEMRTTLAEPDDQTRLRGYIALDRLFHSELCRLSRNPFAEKFHRELNLHLNMTFIYGLGRPPRLKETFEDHQQIVDCLAGYDTDALRVLDRHLAASRRSISQGDAFRSLS